MAVLRRARALRPRRLAIAAGVAAAGVMCLGPAVSASGAPVAPKQFFTAAVNGSTGERHRVVVNVACFGAIHPGQTGHPMAGQSVAVHRVFTGTAGTTALGYTGNRATSIGVFFGAPPPGAAPAPTYINLLRYGTKGIPTSLLLPCAGTGQATFVPLPLDPSEHSIAVPVSFVGQP